MDLVGGVLLLADVTGEDASVVLIARQIFLHCYAAFGVFQVVRVYTADAALACRSHLVSHNQPVSHTIVQVDFASSLVAGCER